MPNPLNAKTQNFFAAGKDRAGSRRGKAPKGEPPPQAEPKPKRAPSPDLSSDLPKKQRPPSGKHQEQIVKLLHNLVGVKKSHEKAAGARSVKK